NGNGEIVLTDGSYDAYGQQLRVNDGRIRFSGAAIDNPDLDIRAVRTGTGFTAGIHIHGPADNPQATLFSTPSMSQDNILSHILLGRPLMQANDSDAAFLASAATGLGIRNGAMIGEQIASSFGLDSFSVSGDTPETTAVEIGKYLSPRLYVSYGIGVFEPVSTMQLRYTLSRLFTLRAESGLETGVDLLYTYERR
ncbi:translocation/assembly module TamB domain-containing protein, partial [Methylophaga lonarensis]